MQSTGHPPCRGCRVAALQLPQSESKEHEIQNPRGSQVLAAGIPFSLWTGGVGLRLVRAGARCAGLGVDGLALVSPFVPSLRHSDRPCLGKVHARKGNGWRQSIFSLWADRF